MSSPPTPNPSPPLANARGGRGDATAALAERAPAKINLTLRVLGRRADGYHELASLVAFADLADTLTLQPAPETALEVTGPFAGQSGPVAANLVLKAVAILGENVGALKAGRFRLEKNIPVAAGIGGGSADAAAALRLVARANDLALDNARLMTAALRTGADVPVCLTSRACIMSGAGERLSPPLELPKLHAVLVNPGEPLATRAVFAAYAGKKTGKQGKSTLPGDVPNELNALIEYLNEQGNDLTDAAIACAPVVADVLGALRVLPGVRLARMSGSGATCFALFASAEESAAAAQRLTGKHRDWWVCATRIG